MSGHSSGSTRSTTRSDRSATRSARSLLAGLMAAVGDTGLAAAAGAPGLLAVVDQHAAAVRDSLSSGPTDVLSSPATLVLPHDPAQWVDGSGRRRLSVIALAGYAEGVRDAAREHGWEPPTGEIDWSAPDWVLIRLLAVCTLARDAGLSR